MVVGGDRLTQHTRIIQNATMSRNALAMKGARFVFVVLTNHSLNTPDRIATMLFSVVMIPYIPLKLEPVLSICLLWYSVTIQLSNALYIKLVLRPPKTRPKNRAGTLGISVERQAME